MGANSEREKPSKPAKVVPVLAEELDVRKAAIPTGGVRVHRRLVEHEEEFEIPLIKERVDVRRVVMDREVAGPLPVRREGDTTIIPIVEEVVRIERRYVLKEEIHVSRTAREERHIEQVVVRRQEAEIEELDAEGRSRLIQVPEQRTAASEHRPAPPEQPSSRPSVRKPKRSILGR
jgi:uncharacterized protein (TIGR02271 family)